MPPKSKLFNSFDRNRMRLSLSVERLIFVLIWFNFNFGSYEPSGGLWIY